MKKPLTEPEFIGGQGDLTKEEQNALTKYFAENKLKSKKSIETKKDSKKGEAVSR